MPVAPLPPNPVVTVVAATRLTEAEFAGSPLGTSLSRIALNPRLQSVIAYENRAGLPEIYNRAIEQSSADDVLVFVHDDVWIEDFYFTDRVLEALRFFDVIGLAGNRKRSPGQRVWMRASLEQTGGDPNLAGAVAHGDGPMGKVGFFGPIVAEVELLDGVFLGTLAQTLKQSQVRFDPRFDFHFYDLDFCRAARARGLRLGTFPLSVTHRSMGNFKSEAWQAASVRYFEKWGS